MIFFLNSHSVQGDVAHLSALIQLWGKEFSDVIVSYHVNLDRSLFVLCCVVCVAVQEIVEAMCSHDAAACVHHIAAVAGQTAPALPLVCGIYVRGPGYGIRRCSMLSYKLGLLCSLQSPISSEWVCSDDAL